MVGELAHIRKMLKIGLSIVLTVPAGLPTRYAERQALARRVRQQITVGRGAQMENGSDIRISEFDLARLRDVAKDRRTEVVHRMIEEITGTMSSVLAS